MNDLALVESRTLREEKIKNIEVLDKVKSIQYLTDNFIVTVNQSANFYEVPEGTIKSTISEHKNELKSDGLKILKNKELEKFKGKLENPTTLKYASKLTIIPRKALLRIGMLLRDSPIAKKVRTYLLNMEKNKSEFTPKLALKTFKEIKKTLDEIAATKEAKLNTAKSIFEKAGVNIPVDLDEINMTEDEIISNNSKQIYVNSRLLEKITKNRRWSKSEMADYIGISRNHLWRLLDWHSATGKTSRKKLLKAFPKYGEDLFIESDNID
jgi:hypothetical protein